MRPPLSARPLTSASLASHLTTIAAITAIAAPLAGCSSDDGEGDSNKETKATITVSGDLSAKIGSKLVVLDYTGGTAEVTMAHWQVKKGPTCVTSLNVRISKADDSCALDLTFEPFGGLPLALVKGEFHASSSFAGPCEEWPDLKPGQQLVYNAKSSKDAYAISKAVPDPQSTEKNASLASWALTIAGNVGFKAKGKGFDATFTKLKVEGAMDSKGNPNASCGTSIGKDLCPDPKEVSLGTDVGSYLKRPLSLYSCTDGTAYDVDEHCGSKAIWLTMYSRWSTKACGGDCAGETVCVKDFFKENTYRPECFKKATNCTGCSGKKTICALPTPDAATGTCYEGIVDGEDMALKEAIGGYKDIYSSASDDEAAAIFVVTQGLEKARGKCKKKADGNLECDGEGPAATQKDCEAAKAKYSIPDDVIMLFDKQKKYWSSNEAIGPNYANSMIVMDGETKIVATFPGQGSNAAGVEQIKAAITKAAEE